MAISLCLTHKSSDRLGNTPCARGATLASATARLHSQASRATRRCADRHTSASDTRRDTRRRRHRHT
ncbi:hypothetical protein C6T53_22135 [Burkholderia multivorans]|nr:hypothetical protein C6T53_22135 [Burkholderia multivorans]